MHELREKAIRLEMFVEKHFIDKHGCVYTMLDKETKKPPTDDFFADAGEPANIADFSVPGYSRREISMYENCGMTTGAYLQSLVFQYQTERNPATLNKAKRCLRALKHIFDIGQKLETGFFPKIYGGRFSPETSSDQCLYAMRAMDRLYPHLADHEKKEIDFMIPAIAEFWRKRKYIYNYWEHKNMQWPIFRFPIFMLLAHNHSKEKKFKDEYERLLRDWKQNYPLQFNLLGNKRKGLIEPDEYERECQAWVVAYMPDFMTMRMIELEYLLNNDAQNLLVPRWRQSVIDMWEQARLTLAPNGKAYNIMLVDMKSGQTRRPPPSDLRTSTTGWSSMIARATVQALNFYPENAEMKKDASSILKKIDSDGMTYFDEPERFPSKTRFQTRFLSGDSITNWLWAYWQGAYQNLWRQ